jgi:segregation and condensation protein B
MENEQPLLQAEEPLPLPETPVDSGTPSYKEMKKNVEAILFMAEQPVSLEALKRFFQTDEPTLIQVLAELSSDYQERGIALVNVAGGYQLGTSPDCEVWVRQFLQNPATTVLSKAALEALAIIAYRQPITRGKVETIRGVNSDAVISSLLEKNLVSEVGKSDELGHPTLLGTTTDFLKYFGLPSLSALPSHPFEATQLSLLDSPAENEPSHEN